MVISKYLPDNYSPSTPIAIIAGKGTYPEQTYQAIRARDFPVKLVAFEGETRESVRAHFKPEDCREIKVGQLGHLLKALRDMKVGYAIMVGQITPKRLFRGLHPDAKALLILAKLKERNAETIFGAIASEIEKIGVHLLDARSFLDHELADAGVMTGGNPKADPDHVEHGIRIAREIARLDVGQGVVVRKGTVISVEAFEGTDDMLRRANTYRTDKLIFIKTSKPGQDYRFDVPVFGMKTLEVMRESGIGVACLEAGRTLILDKETVIRQARRWKIQLVGYE